MKTRIKYIAMELMTASAGGTMILLISPTDAGGGKVLKAGVTYVHLFIVSKY